MCSTAFIKKKNHERFKITSNTLLDFFVNTSSHVFNLLVIDDKHDKKKQNAIKTLFFSVQLNIC